MRPSSVWIWTASFSYNSVIQHLVQHFLGSGWWTAEIGDIKTRITTVHHSRSPVIIGCEGGAGAGRGRGTQLIIAVSPPAPSSSFLGGVFVRAILDHMHMIGRGVALIHELGWATQMHS